MLCAPRNRLAALAAVLKMGGCRALRCSASCLGRIGLEAAHLCLQSDVTDNVPGLVERMAVVALGAASAGTSAAGAGAAAGAACSVSSVRAFFAAGSSVLSATASVVSIALIFQRWLNAQLCASGCKRRLIYACVDDVWQRTRDLGLLSELLWSLGPKNATESVASGR